MNAVLNHISTHMEDNFYWPEPSSHGKPLDLLAIESRIDSLESRYIRLTDAYPIPWDTLDEIEDEIKAWQKIQKRLWNEWQHSISQLRKEQVLA